MLTIGRFADATGLTVKALRHYDEIGLLVPAQVDPDTGYRYYDATQVEDAVAIRRLRALEFPLDEIRALLHADADALRSGLVARGQRVGEEAHDKQMLLIELAATVAAREEPVAVEIVEEPELRLAAAIRQLHQDEVARRIGPMLLGVRRDLERLGVTPTGKPLALFRSGDRWNWHLVEAGWPVTADFHGNDALSVHVYTASRAITYEYEGTLEELHPVAQRFIATVLGQGHRISQPIRVVYLGENSARLVWPIETAEPAAPSGR